MNTVLSCYNTDVYTALPSYNTDVYSMKYATTWVLNSVAPIIAIISCLMTYLITLISL